MTQQIENKNSNQLFIQSTALFLLLAKLLSIKLWLGTRVFPLAPAFDFLENTPSFVHTSLYYISIISLIAIALKPQFNKLLVVIIVAELMSCLLDQSRWQPWEYQYVFMFFVLWYNRKNETIALTLLLVITASIYFYSGLQKINHHFLTLVWKKIFLEQFFHLPHSITQNVSVIRFGYIVPLLEMSFGICLLLNKTRKIAICCLFGMHIFIMVLVGPTGINYNLTVWTWNIAMLAFLYQFWNFKIDVSNIKLLVKNRLNWVVLIAWMFCPVLNFWGYWDYFFSSSLYSGRVDICFVKIQNPPPNFELSQYYKPKKTGDTTNIETISLQTWANDEMDAPPCSQKRVYKKIKQEWAKKYPTVNADFWVIDKSRRKPVATKL